MKSWISHNIRKRRNAEKQWQNYQNNNNSASYLYGALPSCFHFFSTTVHNIT